MEEIERLRKQLAEMRRLGQNKSRLFLTKYHALIATVYEELKKINKEVKPGQATSMMAAQSIAHVIIVIFIIFGNITYYLTRKNQRKEN